MAGGWILRCDRKSEVGARVVFRGHRRSPSISWNTDTSGRCLHWSYDGGGLVALGQHTGLPLARCPTPCSRVEIIETYTAAGYLRISGLGSQEKGLW